MIVSGFEGTCLNSQTEKLIAEQGIGGLILFERNFENPQQLKKLIEDLQAVTAKNSPPLFISFSLKLLTTFMLKKLLIFSADPN